MRLRLPWRKSADTNSPLPSGASASHALTLASSSDLDAQYAQAHALHEAGRVWEAHSLLCTLGVRGFVAPGFARMLGWSHLSLGQRQDAEAWMWQAVATEPDAWQSYYGLAEVLRRRDAIAAKATFAQSLSIDPDNEHCLLGLSACHLSLKESAAAEAVARRVVQLAPESAAGWNNLGSALLMQRRVEEALEAFGASERVSDRTIEDDRQSLNQGIALRLQGRTAEAIEYFEARLPAHPGTGAHAHYGLALLTAGRLAQGWEQYEFRWLDEPLRHERAHYDRPSWNGQNLQGKIILVRSEQGAGDLFQFIRYAPFLKQLGATVLLELHLELGILGKRFEGVDQTLRRGEPLPHFDYFIDLLSLPKAFRTVEASIPARVPYLEPPQSWSDQWRDRLARYGGFKVGVVWAGDPKHPRDRERSMPLAMFEPLVETNGIDWFSLQKGPAAAAASDTQLAGIINLLGPELYEFTDTAAAISNLDLVISVDTSVAHLAGALGKAVWLLLPFVADWRWMEGRDVSPWYPTMRIFRQAQPDDWAAVIQRVRVALADLVSDGSRDSLPTVVSTPRSSRAVDSDMRIGASDERSNGAIARVCRTRFGMIQFVPDGQRLSRSLEYYGDYLHSQLNIANRLVKSGDVVVDVSAGIGLHAIALAGSVGADGQVLAIERSPILRQILLQNLEINELQGVSVMPASAATQSLDDLAFDRVDFVRIGDPGEVARIVDGGEETLHNHAPTLMFSEQPREGLDLLGRRMAKLGYRCWSIETVLFERTNFNCRDDDVFSGARSYALLALPKRLHIPDVLAMPGVAPLFS